MKDRLRVAALIIGIDGWEKYTHPLICSLQEHEPGIDIVLIDNASKEPYPDDFSYLTIRTNRLCYSKAINEAAKWANLEDPEWYLVLSNDVLCTGPFVHLLPQHDMLVGPLLKENQGWQYLEGWCVFAPKAIWEDLGGWDENFRVSSWEDVDFSVSALEKQWDVVEDRTLPFVHLDQRQRFTLIENYWSSEEHNVRYFREKHENH